MDFTIKDVFDKTRAARLSNSWLNGRNSRSAGSCRTRRRSVTGGDRDLPSLPSRSQPPLLRWVRRSGLCRRHGYCPLDPLTNPGWPHRQQALQRCPGQSPWDQMWQWYNHSMITFNLANSPLAKSLFSSSSNQSGVTLSREDEREREEDRERRGMERGGEERRRLHRGLSSDLCLPALCSIDQHQSWWFRLSFLL